MAKLVINSYEDFEKYVGQELGVSDYVELNQERINLFADATLDHQWIHVDTEKAAVESPFKSTIAHGYLTLSMLPYMWNQIIEVNNLKMMINYGMDKMKFGQAVLSGQSIRLKTVLQSLQNLRGVAKAEIKFTIEIKDQRKPAVEGVAVFLYYLNDSRIIIKRKWMCISTHPLSFYNGVVYYQLSVRNGMAGSSLPPMMVPIWKSWKQ